jgi:hypothetical protein
MRSKLMLSQLELLKQALKEGESRSGPDNPFVKGLRMQIATLERKISGDHSPNPSEELATERLSVGSLKAK